MTADTGAALAAAVAANPDDDAPWLVYADWLQEAGRDAEADAVRAHLPALRVAVHNGHDIDTVLSVAVECPPPHPMWNLLHGLPDVLRVVPAPAPAPPAPAPRPVEVPAGSRSDNPAWGPVIYLIMVAAAFAFRAVVSTSNDHRWKPTPPAPHEWTARPPEPPPWPAEVQGLAAARLARLPAPGRRWDPAEVAGSTFRQWPGVPGSGSLTFRADGTVVRNEAPGRPAERWAIGPDGDLQLIGTYSNVTARLVKLRQVEDVYDIEYNGRTELYIRQRP